MSAAALSSELRLCEPTVQVDVNCARDVANVVYAALHRRSALCSAATNDAHEKTFVQIGATMSVRQSMGLVGVLRHETKGQVKFIFLIMFHFYFEKKKYFLFCFCFFL